MTTQQQTQTRTPTEGNNERHDAETEPRYGAQDLRDVSLHLNRIAEFFENGGKPQTVGDHEEASLEIEQVASGGKPQPDEVETMTSPEPAKPRFEEIREDFIREHVDRITASVPNPGKIFSGAVIEVCVDLPFHWKAPGPYSNLPVSTCSIPTFHAARIVAIAMNRESIKNKRLSRAVVVRQRGGKYAVKKLSTGIPVRSVDPTEDHPCVRFGMLKWGEALEEVARFNSNVKKKNGCPKRWYAIVVPIKAVKK